MGNLLLVFAQWTPQHGAQWLPQHAPMGATSHAMCKALPLPCAHHVAMTPAQPSSHWIGFCWGCCANHAHFLCFCDCANILGCGNNCDILVWFGQRTGKTTGCTFPRCVVVKPDSAIFFRLGLAQILGKKLATLGKFGGKHAKFGQNWLNPHWNREKNWVCTVTNNFFFQPIANPIANWPGSCWWSASSQQQPLIPMASWQNPYQSP